MMKQGIYAFIVIFLLISCTQKNPTTADNTSEVYFTDFSGEKIELENSSEYQYVQTISWEEELDGNPLFAYRFTTTNNEMPAGFFADENGWIYHYLPGADKSIPLGLSYERSIWTDLKTFEVIFESVMGELAHIISKVELKYLLDIEESDPISTSFFDDRIIGTRLSTTKGPVDGRTIGKGIAFTINEQLTDIFVEGLYADHFMYRLNIISESDSTLIQAGEWLNTLDCEDIRQVEMNSELGNALIPNEDGELTELEAYIVTRSGFEDSDNPAKMNFKVQDGFYPNTIIYNGLTQNNYQSSNNSFALGENHFVTYMDEALSEEPQHSFVNDEIHYATAPWIDKNGNYVMIGSDDFEYFLQCGYLGEYAGNNPANNYNGIVFASSLDPQVERAFNDCSIFENGKISFNATNYGYLGSEENFGLEWPINSGIDYLSVSSLWIGAKKIRRNELGEALYWTEYPPNHWNNCIPASHPNWTSNLLTVVDTLTTVGFDGDLSVFELLPAYNPLETSALGSQYENNVDFDTVRKVVGEFQNIDDDNDGFTDEDQLGSPFDFSDPTGEFLFTKLYDDDGDNLLDEDCGYPGFVSAISYFYDYSPFGTEGERDFGASAFVSHHGYNQQLNVAVSQEIYSWPVKYFADMIFVKNTIYNTSEVETLYDLAIGYFMDADIGNNNSWNPASDDISSYSLNQKFGFSYDDDGDDEEAEGKIALKILDSDDYEIECWCWTVGDGPGDPDPIYLGFPSSNEKYWLMTGWNPDSNKYQSLEDDPNAQVNDPNDTRFLYSIYGDQNGFNNPTVNSFNLLPQDSFTFYTLIALDNELTGLEVRVQKAEELLANNFDYTTFIGLPSIPYLSSAEEIINTTSAKVCWKLMSDPDEFQVCYKKADAPASTWQYDVVDAALGEYIIEGLEADNEHKFKLGCLFGDVYLESQYKLEYISGDVYEIWPGDSNNDGIVNVDDIIPIGIYWGSSGDAREDISYTWEANGFSYNWSDTMAPFADCNGDGNVDITDVAAICLNWNYTHNLIAAIPYEYPNLLEYEENFMELYNSLNDVGLELLFKNLIASEFDFPIQEIPVHSCLAQNYPNPFNPSTNISYDLAEAGEIELSLYNVKGQLVKKLIDKHQESGHYNISWNGIEENDNPVPSGIYFYQLSLNSKTIATRKMLLLK
jgi:FlgD Ig-like domain